MPQLKLTRFASYVFSDKELIAAGNFTSLNVLYLKTVQADAAEQKLNLVLDPYHPLAYTQQESYLAGQIDILQMLIDGVQTQSPGTGEEAVVKDNWIERYGLQSDSPSN